MLQEEAVKPTYLFLMHLSSAKTLQNELLFSPRNRHGRDGNNFAWRAQPFCFWLVSSYVVQWLRAVAQCQSQVCSLRIAVTMCCCMRCFNNSDSDNPRD